MATKAELQTGYERCELIRLAAGEAEADRDYPTAVQRAESALPHLHAAVTYQRRFLKLVSPTIPPVDCILRYAPPLFLSRALDAVEAWYVGGTKTERTALPDVPERLATARRVMTHAAELWAGFSADPPAPLRPPVSHWTDKVVPIWSAAGLIAQVSVSGSPGYVRVTDVRRHAAGKCSGCGHIREATLSSFLEARSCPKCGRRRQFVIIRRIV